MRKNKNAQQAGGMGLGLALVQHVMEAHQGHIDVHSTLGQGTCFVLHFPKEKSV